MDIFKLLNDCIEKPYRAHFLNREYNHHVYAKAPALAYSFQELGDEVSLVGILLLIQQYFDMLDLSENSCSKRRLTHLNGLPCPLI
jgi:hypothetical protein